MYPKNQIYYTVDLQKEEHKNDPRKNIARKSLDKKFLIWSTRDCAQARCLLKKISGVTLMTHAEALSLTSSDKWQEKEKTLDKELTP